MRNFRSLSMCFIRLAVSNQFNPENSSSAPPTFPLYPPSFPVFCIFPPMVGKYWEPRNLVPDSTGIELFSLIDSRRCLRSLYSPQTTTHSVRPARVHWMEQIVRSWGKISQLSDTKPVSHFSRTPSHWIDYVWPIRDIMSSLRKFDSIIVMGDIISLPAVCYISHFHSCCSFRIKKGNF